MTRVANVLILLFWSGLALIVFGQFGHTAAGLALMSGWLIAVVTEAFRR